MVEDAKPLRVGVVGVGQISTQYFVAFEQLPNLELVAVADLDADRTRRVGADRGEPARTVAELLASTDVDVVLNLTVPAAHLEVGTAALRAGRHLYAEKPLGLSVPEAVVMVELARERGLRIGSAPDIVLGTGVQTARHLLDDGAVGEPYAAAVAWSSPGHEAWHPAPSFYYQPGGGPLLDMGPYYLTALVTLLGPVVRVSGVSRRSSRTRTVATGPQAGTPVPVDVDTSVQAVLEHAGGATSTVSLSFDVRASRRPLFEVYGTTGTLAVPDPNTFDGTVEVWTTAAGDWQPVPPAAGYVGAGRGVGLADLAEAIAVGRPHRASGELALHVLEIMDAVPRSSTEHVAVELATTVERPEPVPLGGSPGTRVSGR